MPNRNYQLFVVEFFLFLLPIAAQQTPDPPIQAIIQRASDQRSVYVDTFKNLLSHETRTFEIYKRDGNVKQRRVVRSNFIVYQLAKDPEKATEYRSVYSVDGKQLGNVETRAQDLFEKIVRVESSDREREKIVAESLRFDEELYISNLTLFQAVALSNELRPSFDFKLAGKESISERPVYVIEYRQTTASPSITIGMNPGKTGLSYDVDLDGLKNPNERLSGKLWIDAETFQVIREHRVLTIQPDDFDRPLPVSENWFEFQKSDFGIFTPKRISHLQYEIDRKKRTSIKDVQIVCEYDRFTRPDVDVKASEVKSP
jgi:hypothetical protein